MYFSVIPLWKTNQTPVETAAATQQWVMMPLDHGEEIQTSPQTEQWSDINQVSIYSSVHCFVRYSQHINHRTIIFSFPFFWRIQIFDSKYNGMN